MRSAFVIVIVAAGWILAGCSKGGGADGRCSGAICTEDGRCKKTKDVCVADKDEDCKKSTGCKAKGNCALFGDRCGPSSQADCDAAEMCGDQPKPESGLAAPGAPGGVAIPACGFNAERHRCQTAICASNGLCSNKREVTSVDTHDNPTLSDVDVQYGSFAVPGDDADCSASRDCKLLGECHVNAKGDRCAPKVDADCKGTPGCAASGRCSVGVSLSEVPECQAKTAADCEQSVVCKESAKCAPDEGSSGDCVAKSSELCRAAPICAKEGRCSKGAGACVADMNDDDCKKSEVCKTTGLCTASLSACQAEKKGDCKKSEVCKKEGKCTVQLGSYTCEKVSLNAP